MNTKKILTYGAIAAGAYLAYTFLFKKKSSDANFANANGGYNLAIPSKYDFFQKYSNYSKVTLEQCFNSLMDRVKNWRLYYTQPMDLALMEAYFEKCLKARPIKTMSTKSNVGSPIGR